MLPALLQQQQHTGKNDQQIATGNPQQKPMSSTTAMTTTTTTRSTTTTTTQSWRFPACLKSLSAARLEPPGQNSASPKHSNHSQAFAPSTHSWERQPQPMNSKRYRVTAASQEFHAASRPPPIKHPPGRYPLRVPSDRDPPAPRLSLSM